MPVDYSKLTDAELDALLAKQPKDYSKLTDAELDAEIAKSSGNNQEVLDEAADLDGRFAVKNFGGDTAAQIEYLKSKNPGVDITTKEVPGMLWGTNEEIVAKRPGESAYKRLDPSTVSDLPRDVLDVLWDVPAGVAQNIAAAGAGIAGGASTLGVGALPAAVAAGGATGGALETARQTIGKYLGTAKEYDPTMIGATTVAGGLSPLLFGTGATAAQGAKALLDPAKAANQFTKATTKYIAPGTALTQAEQGIAEDALMQSQKGILSGLGKKAVSAFTGVADDDLLRTATKEVSPDLVQSISKVYQIDPNRKYTHLEMADIVKRQGRGDMGEIAASGIRDSIENAKNETGAIINEALAASPEIVNVSKYEKPLRDFIDLNEGRFSRTETGLFKEEAAKAQKLIDDYFPAQGSKGAEGMSAQDAFAFKEQLDNILTVAQSPIQLDKKSSVSKQLANKLIEAKKGLEDEIDLILKGQNAEGARAAYRQNRDLMRSLYPQFKDEAKSAQTLQSLGNNSKDVLRQQLQDFDNTYGTKTLELADIAQVGKVFAKASNEAVSSNNASSTGKKAFGAGLGGGMGYLLGTSTGLPMGGQVGGLLGLAAGGLATSPAVVKKGLQTETLLNRLVGSGMNKVQAQSIIENINNQIKKLPPAVQPAGSPQTAVPAIWNMMQGGGQ